MKPGLAARAIAALVLAAGCAHESGSKPQQTASTAQGQPAPKGSASAPGQTGATPSAQTQPGSNTTAQGQAGATAQAQPAPETPDAPFRASPPPPSEAAPFRAPVPAEFTLQNGLRVHLIERHEVPLVAVALSVRSGADTDPPGRAGLASFTLDMLDEGTKSRDAAAIARGFEDLAARYNVQPDADASVVSVVALPDTLAKALEIFAEVVLRPAFTEADLARVKQERLGQIAQALDDPATIGQHVLSRMIYGEKHPWGFPGEGTVKSIQSLTRKDVVAWHAGAFRPSNAAIFVVGDVTEAQLEPLLSKQFGHWVDSAAPKPRQHPLPKGAPRVVTVVDKPGAPQSQIWIGEVGVASADKDVFAARVMNAILGGTFNSRLNGNLRTEHAYSYGAFSFFETHRQAGPFIAEAGVVSDKTAQAVSEFLRELTRMQTGAVTDAELSDAKAALVLEVPSRLTSDEQTAQAYASVWAHGLPNDYYAHFEEHIEAVNKDDVARAARDRLHPDKMAIVVVGPKTQIESGLSALHVGALEFRDATGEAAKAANAAAKAQP